jgi:hypothetical protein
MSEPQAVRKGEHVMSTMMGNMRWAILAGLVAGAVVTCAGVRGARADVTSDQPGAILIWPKIVVDINGELGPQRDTEIQVTNTSNSVIAARCWIVDATSHCSNAPDRACLESTDCPIGGLCIPQWSDIDFRMTLTKRQPVTWNASQGLASFPCPGIVGDNCPFGQSNRGSDGSPSFVPPVQETPFFGEMKCVEVDANTFQPSRGFDPANNLAGDLKGEATIVTLEEHENESSADLLDARKYNAIALEATARAGNPETCPIPGVPPELCLQIGGPLAQYNGCPNVLIVNHFFDDAEVPSNGGRVDGGVVSDLTVIPCGEDFRLQENRLGGAVMQFLVYNEFEQRFSTSTNFQCWREVQLSDIDTRPGPFGNAQSIFNVGVQGTLTGQSRIRTVAGPDFGNTILGVLEEFWQCDPERHPEGVCSTAANLHQTGTRDQGDLLIISPELP